MAVYIVVAVKMLIFAAVWFSFFFFQAEDGIRDYKVTGVQTCALPISCSRAARLARPLREHAVATMVRTPVLNDSFASLRDLLAEVSCRGWALALGATLRSEERRVGKECRSRWSPYH